MTLLDVFDWLELTWLGATIRESLWLFPVIEAVHLLGLAMLGGAVLVVDLRLLGFGLRDRPVGYVVEQLNPWLLGAVGVMFATGIPLFLSEAVKCYWSDAFWVKMGALLLALIFTFAVRNPAARRLSGLAPWKSRLLAAGSLCLWLTVAAAGRWIGFS